MVSYTTNAHSIFKVVNNVDAYLHGNESAEVTSSVAKSHGRLPAKGLIPEERNVDALKSGQSNVVPSKVFDVTHAVNDNRSPGSIRMMRT